MLYYSLANKPFVIRSFVTLFGLLNATLFYSVFNLSFQDPAILIGLMAATQLIVNYFLGKILESTHIKHWRDPLTDLSNRAFANGLFKRLKNDYSVVIIDLDHFKKYNDTYGHFAGDVLLQRVSRIFSQSMRRTDHAIRWGGEEFLLVFPRTDVKTAALIAERIKDKVHEETGATFSAGCVAVNSNYKHSLNIADQALYKAKEKRNAVVIGN
jgi:diguanylate cyclase (GGDEF)-like protein